MAWHFMTKFTTFIQYFAVGLDTVRNFIILNISEATCILA